MKLCISFFFILITIVSFAQTDNSSNTPISWQLLDSQKDGYPGISLEKAYNELLKNKKPLKKIVVAIIDEGLDDKHPDLAGMEWTNIKEIPGNNIDDDKNGFVDDVHGWNFIGNAKHETFEALREYVRLRNQFENNADTIALKSSPQYTYWKKIVIEKDKIFDRIKWFDTILIQLHILQDYWSEKLRNDSVYIKKVKNHQPDAGSDSSVIKAYDYFMNVLGPNPNVDNWTLIYTIDYLNQNNEDAKTIIERSDPAYFRRKELGDDPYTNTKRNYGNSNTDPDYPHGTACSGVIASLRNNSIGANGITNSVEIMPVRIIVVPNSDEWDKDVANAVIYAVDNGAQVINMSFGKSLSPQKSWVDDAVKYAEQKGVLIVNAAGNNASNVDSLPSYPEPYYQDKSRALNFIKVGATTYDSLLVATFSNYGSDAVDVFAPGVNIYTTDLNNKYMSVDGTSMAAPIVTGLAALIWSYYPQFSYKQIRYCIEESVKPFDIMVTKPGTEEKVSFRTLSRKGGIVNAYHALVIADSIATK